MEKMDRKGGEERNSGDVIAVGWINEVGFIIWVGTGVAVLIARSR